MTIAALNALNLSVANAEKFVDSVKDNSRILSFFLGGSSVETESNLNTDLRRSTVYKDASIIKRVQPSYVNVVAKNIPWVRGQVYNKWNSSSTSNTRHYVSYNNNVYLILDNSVNNTIRENGKIPVSTPPVHTSGVVKYNDGYSYLYLYTISATDKANVNSSEFIAVPDTTVTTHSGKILTAEIDLSEISSSNLVIGEKNPVIPILSDTGSGASIRLNTIVVSSPYATLSERLYKIIGVETINHGTTPYTDFELIPSLTAVLTDESAAQIADIAGAITIGFSSFEGIRVRDILVAKYAVINMELDSSSITGEIDQTSFFNFGILEDVQKTDGQKLFTGDDTGESFSNQLKLTIVPLGTASSDPSTFEIGDNVVISSISGSSQKQNSKVVSSKQAPFTRINLEVHTTQLDTATTGGKITFPKNDSIYTISSVTKPNIKQNSGKTLHIGATRFSLDDNVVNKRFFAQVIQRF